MSRRYFVDQSLGDAILAMLTDAEAHHLLHVMRAKAGDELTLFDGSGWEFEARISRVGRNEVECEIVSRAEVDRELRVELTLAVALPKGDRQRWLVEKATELGVSRLIPLETARGVAQPTEKALERLRRTIVEASKQCGRNRLMEIAAPENFDLLIATPAADSQRFLAHPGGSPLARIDLVHPAKLAAPIWFAVGPEGGFTSTEHEAASSCGWQAVDLGARILRVETAAIALAAVVSSLNPLRSQET